jgi:hypothetical protein
MERVQSLTFFVLRSRTISTSRASLWTHSRPILLSTVLKGKLIMTSNYFLDFGGDIGVARRVIYKKYPYDFVKTPEKVNAAEFKFLANPDLLESSLKDGSAKKKSDFFNRFAKGARCYLNRYDINNFVVPVCDAFVLGKHIPTLNSMLKNYVSCVGGNVSLYDIFNEYVKHCEGFQTLTKAQFKLKMMSLKVEFSSNGRGTGNTIGYFKIIMSLHDYKYKVDRMSDCVSELGEDIMECGAVEYDRRYNKRT